METIEPAAGDSGAHTPTMLRLLVTGRHWQKFTTFERQFSRAARELAERQGEPELAKVTVSSRQFERWHAGEVKTTPHPDACRILEFMFGLPVTDLLAPAREASGTASPVLSSADAARLTTWLTATSVSDEAISGLDLAAAQVAGSHAQSPPAVVLVSARQVQASAQALLRAGPRHRQERELLRINGNLLAHISLLLSDIGDDVAGEKYGHAALAYLREAGTGEEIAWYVLAKTARWRHNYGKAADLARAGTYHGAPAPMRVQLACYEANTAALAGDKARATAAMRLAEDTAAALPYGEMTWSPWSFPEERMTIFKMSLAISAGDPVPALQAAAAWNPHAVAGRPLVTAAWIQIRIAAAIARLQSGALDGAADEVAPVLALPPPFRITTITGWLDDLSRQLSADQYAGSPIAAGLQEQIRYFGTETPATRKNSLPESADAAL